MAVRWEAMRSQASNDFDRLAADLVLEASYRQLGRTVEQRKAVERIVQNPAVQSAGGNTKTKLDGGVTDEIVESLAQSSPVRRWRRNRAPLVREEEALPQVITHWQPGFVTNSKRRGML